MSSRERQSYYFPSGNHLHLGIYSHQGNLCLHSPSTASTERLQRKKTHRKGRREREAERERERQRQSYYFPSRYIFTLRESMSLLSLSSKHREIAHTEK